ncbi:uncharacterized protein GGS25DRAFT_467698 [Hypoxylon fragiforme]|uniref:uncharacterized protein n=1 Tax=Hypoxylon fragiforme TaxID=63214 RepID=UPI0020C5C7BD|nr:uncharacterized protein GGS25DRAFT_467698 [Hypoxylon fragiforme]KAI2613552.1 hypothetical protein GGS25DRAFT_467698 [Hypoxylon fragiforme]
MYYARLRLFSVALQLLYTHMHSIVPTYSYIEPGNNTSSCLPYVGSNAEVSSLLNTEPARFPTFPHFQVLSLLYWESESYKRQQVIHSTYHVSVIRIGHTQAIYSYLY